MGGYIPILGGVCAEEAARSFKEPAMEYRMDPNRQPRFIIRSCFGGTNAAFVASGSEACSPPSYCTFWYALLLEAKSSSSTASPNRAADLHSRSICHSDAHLLCKKHPAAYAEAFMVRCPWHAVCSIPLVTD